MSIRSLLKKYSLMDKKIESINYHTKILGCNEKDVFESLYNKKLIPDYKDLNEEQQAILALTLMNMSDSNSTDYNFDVDRELVSIGLNLTETIGSGHNRNKWDNGLFEDDYFGFGRRATDMYDDYIDSMGDLENSGNNK